MKPQKPDNNVNLFRSKLSHILNLWHPLVRLSEKMNGEKLEADINIIYNESAGQSSVTHSFTGDTSNTPLIRAIKALWNAGLKTHIGRTFVDSNTCNTNSPYTPPDWFVGATESV